MRLDVTMLDGGILDVQEAKSNEAYPSDGFKAQKATMPTLFYCDENSHILLFKTVKKLNATQVELVRISLSVVKRCFSKIYLITFKETVRI